MLNTNEMLDHAWAIYVMSNSAKTSKWTKVASFTVPKQSPMPGRCQTYQISCDSGLGSGLAFGDTLAPLVLAPITDAIFYSPSLLAPRQIDIEKEIFDVP